MSDGEQTEQPAEEDSVDLDPDEDSNDDPSDVDGEESESAEMFSHYGVASAVLGVLSVAAVVLAVIIWSDHRDEVAERGYLSRAMQTAADWTNVLINMNSGNVDASLQRLHDGTVGELNTDFDAAVQPYKAVVEKLQSKSAGRIDAVAIETVHHDLDTQPAGTSRQGRWSPRSCRRSRPEPIR